MRTRAGSGLLMLAGCAAFVHCPLHADAAIMSNSCRCGLPFRSERGAETIRHFLFDVAKMTGDWKMEDVLEEEMEKIRQQVG